MERQWKMKKIWRKRRAKDVEKGDRQVTRCIIDKR